MVRVWYMGEIKVDKRLENHRDPLEYINIDQLFKLTGVEYFQIPAENYSTNTELLEILKKRGITYDDQIICSKECLPNFEEKLRTFFEEHLHTDEEIRYILDGSGYFDVRDKFDQWIRIEVIAGDMLIIPAGIYHRFTLDIKNFIKSKRYFVGEPVWTPYNRPSDDMECRKSYLRMMQVSN